MHLIVVRAGYDDEAGVWYVTESDVPGLVAEADSVEALKEKLLAMIPELLEANGFEVDRDEIPLDLIAYTHARVRLRAQA